MPIGLTVKQPQPAIIQWDNGRGKWRDIGTTPWNMWPCFHVETGRNEEAHALVARSMDLEGIDEPFPGDWLVVGRIRENYGLVDDALEAYSRLAPRGGSRPLPDTVEALGSSRAKALLGRRRKGD